MKFSWKILFCTMLIMAAACGASGYFFVNYVFQTSMERETRQALDESSILRFAFETAALNIPSKYDVLPDGTVEQIGVYLENSGQHGNRLLRISDENGKVLYVSEGFTGDTSLWEERGENTRVYRVVQSGDSYYIQTQTRINVSDRMLTLETMKNVTAVYTERTEGFRMYRQVTVIVLLCSGAVMTLIACWLTRPIRLLTRATGKMAEGEYSYRAEQISNDEMGQLTADFNHMAEALEQNIQNLENEVRAREDFIAAFSHELKTPLTAIIGYADMLRSRKLDDERHFLCANYIYTEGKRLETMALRLLDIIVTRRNGLCCPALGSASHQRRGLLCQIPAEHCPSGNRPRCPGQAPGPQRNHSGPGSGDLVGGSGGGRGGPGGPPFENSLPGGGCGLGGDRPHCRGYPPSAGPGEGGGAGRGELHPCGPAGGQRHPGPPRSGPGGTDEP